MTSAIRGIGERRLLRLFAAATLFSLAHGFFSSALAAQPIVTDSRIKTFVYNPNEVFAVTTHYGYQSNIEFADKETIDTVSVGDRVAWQIIPAGRRLFIRAMEENAHTNMTVVTNLHAYQFDLRSSASDAVFGSEELTYVVRFFYPDANAYSSISASMPDFTPPANAPINASFSSPAPAPAPVGYIQPPVVAPRVAVPAPSVTTPSVASNRASYNYRYTYSGPSDAAPLKIYDDGASTYFRFPTAVTPKISAITSRGERLAVPVRLLPGNLVAVDVVAPSFSIEQPAGQVVIYNESGGA